MKRLIIALFLTATTSVISKGQTSGTENGHEWVDLGLSVKWATCNIGASSPSGIGGFYAWGETSTKTEYRWSTLRYCNDNTGDNFTKYSIEDNKTRLDLSDDAARSNWGGKWRMPTKNEFEELVKNCTYVWTSINGVDGYLVKSKKNGKTIFFPVTGCWSGTSDYALDFGYYWSSNSEAGFAGWGLEFCPPEESSQYRAPFGTRYNNRYLGYQIRPVMK